MSSESTCGKLPVKGIWQARGVSCQLLHPLDSGKQSEDLPGQQRSLLSPLTQWLGRKAQLCLAPCLGSLSQNAGARRPGWEVRPSFLFRPGTASPCPRAAGGGGGCVGGARVRPLQKGNRVSQCQISLFPSLIGGVLCCRMKTSERESHSRGAIKVGTLPSGPGPQRARRP